MNGTQEQVESTTLVGHDAAAAASSSPIPGTHNFVPYSSYRDPRPVGENRKLIYSYCADTSARTAAFCGAGVAMKNGAPDNGDGAAFESRA